ncbi:MAG: hypothetical protein ACOYKZ_01690 [Chlamydiia bacterium]
MSVSLGLSWSGSDKFTKFGGWDIGVVDVKLPNSSVEISASIDLQGSEPQEKRLTFKVRRPEPNSLSGHIETAPLALNCALDKAKSMQLSARIFQMYDNRRVLTMHPDGKVTGELRARRDTLPVFYKPESVLSSLREGKAYMVTITNRDDSLEATIREVTTEALTQAVRRESHVGTSSLNPMQGSPSWSHIEGSMSAAIHRRQMSRMVDQMMPVVAADIAPRIGQVLSGMQGNAQAMPKRTESASSSTSSAPAELQFMQEFMPGVDLAQEFGVKQQSDRVALKREVNRAIDDSLASTAPTLWAMFGLRDPDESASDSSESDSEDDGAGINVGASSTTSTSQPSGRGEVDSETVRQQGRSYIHAGLRNLGRAFSMDSSGRIDAAQMNQFSSLVSQALPGFDGMCAAGSQVDAALANETIPSLEAKLAAANKRLEQARIDFKRAADSGGDDIMQELQKKQRVMAEVMSLTATLERKRGGPSASTGGRQPSAANLASQCKMQ